MTQDQRTGKTIAAKPDGHMYLCEPSDPCPCRVRLERLQNILSSAQTEAREKIVDIPAEIERLQQIMRVIR